MPTLEEWDAATIVEAIIKDKQLAVRFSSPSPLELDKINNPLLYGRGDCIKIQEQNADIRRI